MQRKEFVKQTSIMAIGIGVFGKLEWNNDHFTGDTPTTSDILGPFYRPGAPFRENLNPADFKGEILHLSGSIFKEDGKTPMKNCLIEIWQCKQDGFYDNVSDDFLYRASQNVEASGRYHFITTTPIPYPNDERKDVFRPAHIHIRISAEGQQDLITQIYLKGDPYLESDPSTKSELSINRILSIKQLKDRESEIKFDIVLKKEYVADDNVFHKVSGIYKMSDMSMMEFYRDGDFLFYKTNNQIWGGLSYSGNNTFTGGVNSTEARFELLTQGEAKVQFRFSRRKETKLEGTKLLNYKK
jgi:protocatechuate 3,4-dioxygenase beta subunit